jgi:hypothetical protein
MLFLQQLGANPANASWLRNDDLTWCRDIKEKYCFVQIPGQDTPEPVEIARPRAEALVHRNCVVDSERWLVPEALFAPERFGVDARSITTIVIAAANAAARALSSAEVVGNVQPGPVGKDTSPSNGCPSAYQQLNVFQRLLSSIVVVGAASDLPNLRHRIEIDVSAAVKNDRLKARVRLPAFAGTGRPAGDTIFQGGCVLASSALGIKCSLGSASTQAAEKATHRTFVRDPAPWLTRVKMSQVFREQCLDAVAKASAGQVPSKSDTS